MLQLEDLAALVRQYSASLESRVRPLDLRGKKLDFNLRPALMGVINLSPDSWYRESVCLGIEQAIRRGQVLSAQGADLIDVGAESTLAHASRADAAAQSSKLLPVLEGLHATGIPVSIETYDGAVARAALEAGAALINFTGRKGAHEVYRMVGEFGAGVIICHVQGANAREVADLELGSDPIGALLEFFRKEVDEATSCGARTIVLDPGLGFYYRNLQDSMSRIRYQMKAFLNTFRLRELGCPVCHALPHAFEFFGEEVRCAEPFFAVLAALGKTDLFRTHEISRVRAVLDTLSAYQPGAAS